MLESNRVVENYQQKKQRNKKTKWKFIFPIRLVAAQWTTFFIMSPSIMVLWKIQSFHFSTFPSAPQLLIPNSLLLSRMYPAPFLSASASVHEHTFITISLWSVFPTRLEASWRKSPGSPQYLQSCWTEVGPKRGSIKMSLMSRCRD